MIVTFSKYHGTGNDFIILDGRKFDMKTLTTDIISMLCDRHFGIGADGLIILAESQEQDFKMIYFNADGKEGSMCGNGGRCIVSYANEIGAVNQACTFEAADGLHSATILVDGSVRLKLNDVMDIQQMPDGVFLDTGSPHFILFRMQIDNIDVVEEGRSIRNEARFTNGSNVNFVELTPRGIKVRTYERGVENETLSCGTGVTAAAIAANFSGLHQDTRVDVNTRGGDLQVEFDKVEGRKVSNLFLTGPAEKVFEGTLRVEG